MRILKSLSLLMVLSMTFFLSSNVSGQVGNTGAPLSDIDMIPVCWNINGVDSTLFLGLVTTVGESSVVDTIGYINAYGVEIAPIGGAFVGGYCATTNAGTDYEYIQAEICDNAGNRYLRIYRINEDGTITLTSTIDESGSTGITINLPVTFEWCNLSAYESPVVTRMTVTTTSVLIPMPSFGRASIEVINVGHTIATLGLDGNQQPLLPGERYFCHMHYDFTERTQRMCNSAYEIIANGGKVRVVQQFED